MSGPRMPFGKHEGVEIEDVPIEYLRWVLEYSGNASPELLSVIEDEIVERGEG